jgi:chemotaxis protein MotB
MRPHQRLRREQGRNTDDWLITYADTITLLLCLFVIILSIRNSGKSLAHDAVPPVTQVVASDSIFGAGAAFPARSCSVAPTAGIVDEAPVAFVEAPVSFVGDTPQLEPVAQAVVAERVVVADVRPEARLAVRKEAASTSLPAVVDRLASLGAAVVEQQSDRLTTLQIGSTAVFGSGSAALSSAGKSILSDVAVSLRSPEFSAYHITIEGHTDDTPINTVQFQSNWELSAARASAVVRYFLEQGIAADKLTAAGYADTFPIAPNRNADGAVIPDNQARNRRVVIKLEKIDKVERPG